MATPKNNNIEAQPTKSLFIFKQKISALFHKKYFLNEDYYSTRLINDIIYNEKCQLVSKFKDFLIWDDDSEFSKRFYTRRESSIRLPKFFDYYENYSKIFPNYTILLESKYIYKNIHKKQKVIDIQQENISHDNSNNINDLSDYDNDVFSTEVYNSIINDNEDIGILFNLSNTIEDNDEKEVNALINLISINEKLEIDLTNRTIAGVHHSNYIGSVDFVNKKKVLSPKTYQNHYYHDHLYNRIKGKKTNLSLSQLLKQQILLNKSNHDNSKEHSIGRLRNERYHLINSAFNSFHAKNTLSITLSHHIPQASVIPITYRDNNKYQSKCYYSNNSKNQNINENIGNDESNRKYNNEINKEQNALSPPKQIDNNIIKVNIKMKDIKPITSQKTLISQIQASNKFYFQSHLIGSHMSKHLQKANEARNQFFSPSITSRKNNTYNNSNNNSNSNSHLNEKENNKKKIQTINLFLTERTPHNPKEIDKMIKQSIKIKSHPQWNNSIKTNNINSKKNCVIKKRESGRTTYTVRSNHGIMHQLNYSSNNSNVSNYSQSMTKGILNSQIINEKKGNNTIVASYSSTIAEKSPIKNLIKGIEIKNFSKAIGLFEKPNKKINSERHVMRKRNVLNI